MNKFLTAAMGKVSLRGLAVGLIWAGLCIGALSVFASLPEFAAGVSADAEGVVVVFYVAAAFSFAGLALFAIATPAALRYLGHPLVLACAALGAWSLVGSAFADFPTLALFGAPQTGEGPIWFFALGAFIASAMILRQSNRLFEALVTITAGVALIVGFVNLANILWLWKVVPSILFETTFFTFNEYLGYYALGILPLAALSFRRGASRRGFALFACGVFVLLVSRNRVAMVATGVVSIALLVLVGTAPGRRAQVWAAVHDSLVGRLIAAGLLATAALPPLLLRLVDFRDHAFSLWSRQILIKVLDPSIVENARAVIFGHGWGHYSEYLTRNLPSTGIRLYKTEWGDITRDEFHSHNALVEALFSAGVPGLLLTLAIPVVLVLTSQRRWRALAAALAVSWVVIDAFWFSLPATMVVFALAAGAMAETSSRLRLPYPSGLKSRNFQGLAVGACLVLAEIAALAAGSLRANGLAMQRLGDCLPPSAYQDACAKLAVPRDPRGAELGLAGLVEDSSRRALRLNADGDLPEGQRLLLKRVLGEAAKRSAAGSSVSLSVALANISAAAAFTKDGEAILPDGDTLQNVWPRQIYDVLARAPLRLDILPTYFNWLLVEKNSEDARVMLAFARGIDPDHPVVLWFEGVALLENYDVATRKRGLELMRRALAGGIERFMPVNEKIKAALEKGDHQ
ncbi:MAG: hypothetical protein P4L72_13325 [Parvibaculum sp.]|uniref:hypothetical protein n=1 Tax=Parvibaculum sp. TaxID=2024848 RepID=UPI00283DA576|nr:hypothetical protein [Parvibaculum sp.]MDR3500195.1 hypothetical protein [Parvibaculum sp.]